MKQTLTMSFCFICFRAQYGRPGMSALLKESGGRGEPVFGAMTLGISIHKKTADF